MIKFKSSDRIDQSKPQPDPNSPDPTLIPPEPTNLTVLFQFRTSRISKIIGLVISLLILGFGMEAVFLHNYFPADASLSFKIMGWAALAIGIFFVYGALTDIFSRKSPLSITDQGLLLDILAFQKQRLFIPWTALTKVEVKNIKRDSEDTFGNDYVSLALQSGFPIPRDKISRARLSADNELLLETGSFNERPGQVVDKIKTYWGRG